MTASVISEGPGSGAANRAAGLLPPREPQRTLVVLSQRRIERGVPSTTLIACQRNANADGSKRIEWPLWAK